MNPSQQLYTDIDKAMAETTPPAKATASRKSGGK
jgi:hypothetical protein